MSDDPDEESRPNVVVLNRFQKAAQQAVDGGRPAAGPRKPGASLDLHLEEWEEGEIVPRQWLVPGLFMRRTITMISGKPASGKSLFTIGLACAMALGQPWGRFRPTGRLNVGLYCIEDDDDEVRRRMSAALSHFGVTPRDLEGRLTRIYPASSPILLQYGVDETGVNQVRDTPAMLDLQEAMMTARGPTDVLLVDPLIDTHTAKENINEEMLAVMARYRRFCRDYDLAFGGVHHVRKGSDEDAGNAEISRGASSIIGAARQVITCAPMTTVEAERLGLNPALRHSFSRIDCAKSNYGITGSEDWFEKVPYILGNADREEVVALVPWATPKPNTLDQGPLLDLAAHIGHGICGLPYSPKLSTEDRSIRRLFQKFGISGKSEKLVMKQLQDMGITSERFFGPTRHFVLGLRTRDKLPLAPWEDGANAVMPEPDPEMPPASVSLGTASVSPQIAQVVPPERFDWGF
jgi:hypothetical protein